MILGKRHPPEVAETYHKMFNCCSKQQDYDNALIFYKQSLIIEKWTKEIQYQQQKQFIRIGLVNEDLGLLDDASEYYDNALKNRMKILGSNDIDVAFSLQRYDSLKIY